jgi:hypothetical protein
MASFNVFFEKFFVFFFFFLKQDSNLFDNRDNTFSTNNITDNGWNIMSHKIIKRFYQTNLLNIA